ncbi:hypothetical protein COOONC_21879 [Cooperia oncophora]
MVEEARVIKFERLSALVREEVLEAAERGLPLNYGVIRHIALRINLEHKLIDDFRASKSWVAKFVRQCCSRKVTHFVTSKSLRCRHDVEAEAEAFVKAVREEMKKYPRSAFRQRRSDSCEQGAPVGSKQVMRLVHSVSSLTHSFTAMPVIYADGRLGEKLLVILPERGGVFPQCGHWQAPNLLVMAGKTHIMTKAQVPTFVEECVVGSSSPPLTILLVDSWSGFTDHSNVLSKVPDGKEVRLMTIPAGATALCQPLDVYFFRVFKRYIRRIYDHVAHHHPDFTYNRDNILKVSAWLTKTNGEGRGWKSSPALMQQRRTTRMVKAWLLRCCITIADCPFGTRLGTTDEQNSISTISEIPRVVVTVAGDVKDDRPKSSCLSLMYNFSEQEQERSLSSRCSFSLDLDQTTATEIPLHSLSLDSC